MLVEFSLENYMSFKNKQTLSMVATPDSSLIDSHTFEYAQESKTKLLRHMLLYGPNASGKSKLIHSMYSLKSLVTTSATSIRSGDKIPLITPFKLDPKSITMPTSMDIMFVIDETRYHYGVKLDENKVYEEWLDTYPHKRKQTWYSRKLNLNSNSYEYRWGKNLSGPKERIANFVRPNSLFLSHAAQNNHEQLTKVYNWFSDTFRFISKDNPYEVRHYTANISSKNEIFHSNVLKFLKVADIGIENFSIDVQPIDRQLDFIYELFSEDAKEQFRETTFPLVKMLHKVDGVDKYVTFDMEREESDGTQRLFELAGPFIHVLNSGSILVVDEMSRHLHPLLSRFLMSLFTNKKINKNNAQLICTTHDVTLINLKHLRRDQVWFVEKDNIQASSLRPLSDYSPRKGEAIEKGYLAGRYGAIPIFNEYSKI